MKDRLHIIQSSTRRAASYTLLGAVLLVAGKADAEDRPGESEPERSARPDVVILESTASRLVFEYRPRFLPERTVTYASRQFRVVDFEQSIPVTGGRRTGLPDVRLRFVPVAFPTASGHTLRVIAADYEDRQGVEIAPVPEVVERDGLPETFRYIPRPDTAAREISGPGMQADLMQPDRVRSAYLGGVLLYPVQVQQGGGLVRTYSRLVVEVTFGGSPRSGVEPGDVQLLRNAVINGETFATWRTSAPRLSRTTLTSSVLASGDWYRMQVTEEGIYRIDAAVLQAAGVNTAGLDPRTIKVYGNGGRELPERVSTARPDDLVENAIYVEGEADGQFGAGDYVLFFGRGTRGWTYDAANRTVRHYINRYSETNTYWITFGGAPGKRMQPKPSLSTPPAAVVDQFLDGVFNEEEKVNLLSSGKDWYGVSLSGPSGSFTYVNALPGLVAGQTILYRYQLVAQDATQPSFTVREGTTTIGVHNLWPAYGSQKATSAMFEARGTSSLSNGTSQLSYQFSSPSIASQAWIDWFEILYPRMLWGVNDYLRFRSPDTAAVFEYILQQFTAMPVIFDVTDPANVRMMTGITGSYTFRDSTRGGLMTEYCAAGSKAWKSPGTLTKVANQNLRGHAEGADFIILTVAELRAAADRLKAFREQPAYGGLRTLVVDVQQVYNEFGGGLPDISAIRDFLKYTYDNWTPRPTFVLLFGGASYDYKGIRGAKTNLVSTWQSAESQHDIDSYSTDDFFVMFGSGSGLSMVSGRMTPNTLQEANALVDKIIRYEQSSDRDPWRMRAVFVGDDGWTSDGGDIEGALHSDQVEELTQTTYTPADIERRKVYLAEYPTAFTSQGRRKPGVYQAIIDQINQGALIVNFTGHGNPKVWAHELVFDITTSIPKLTNATRPSLFFLATCNFSQFDGGQERSGGELLLFKQDGGAIGVISASRKVYSTNNATLNKGTYLQLFQRDAFDRVVVERPATALFRYKVVGFNIDNDQKFFYLGDPTTRLVYPRGFASVDSVNGELLDSLGGQPRQQPVLIKALARVTVAGMVRDAQNRPDTTASGTVSIVINDVSRRQMIVNFSPGFNWSYLASGGVIYRGEVSVVRGAYRATFVVPKDIAYADTTGRGRFVAYFNGGGGDGAGFTDMLRIGGTDSSAADDRQGPAINLYVGSRSFRPGDMVNEQAPLLIDLSDSSGVNTSTSGIGHRIEAWFNSAAQSRDVTGFYVSKLDNFREGTVTVPLAELPQGRNTVRVRAWDSYNNSSLAETYFDVTSSEALTLRDVLNYPNPFTDGTLFTFRQNQAGPLDVRIKIYTLAGRLIQSLETTVGGDPLVRVPWDGRDRDGDLIANGVYLYKVVVQTVDGRYSSEALGKCSIVR